MRIWLVLLLMTLGLARLAFCDDGTITRDRSGFSPAVKERLLQIARATWIEDDARSYAWHCPLAQAYARAVLDKLLSKSGLPKLRLHVTCEIDGVVMAYEAAGIIHISAEALTDLKSEDEIAALLAPEIAHSTLGHDEELLEFSLKAGLDKIKQNEVPPGTLKRLNQMKWRQVLNADEAGLIILKNAGYDPFASQAVLDHFFRTTDPFTARIVEPGADHPSAGERIVFLGKLIRNSGFEKIHRRDGAPKPVVEEIKNRDHQLVSAKPD